MEVNVADGTNAESLFMKVSLSHSLTFSLSHFLTFLLSYSHSLSLYHSLTLSRVAIYAGWAHTQRERRSVERFFSWVGRSGARARAFSLKVAWWGTGHTHTYSRGDGILGSRSPAPTLSLTLSQTLSLTHPLSLTHTSSLSRTGHPRSVRIQLQPRA